MSRLPVACLLAVLLIVTVSPAVSRTYKKALPGYRFSFPRDHASHDEFKTEWWYFTGHLQGEKNEKYGFELTFFRTGTDSQPARRPGSQWNLDNLYLAHFAISDLTARKFHYYEKLNRSGLSVAGARQDCCLVFNESWSMKLLGDNFVLSADSKDYELSLVLNSRKPPVVHGTDGVSQKADCKGCASHYYSMTRLDATGILIDRKKNKPMKVRGTAWMDHEFGSNQLTAEQIGWDWFSIQLATGRELMIYVMRNENGTTDPHSSGTIIDVDGSSRHLRKDEFRVEVTDQWKSPISGGVYPISWRVLVPSERLELVLDPVFSGQELVTRKSTGVTYWEGAVRVRGREGMKSVTGNAYVEMTGYAEKFRKKI